MRALALAVLLLAGCGKPSAPAAAAAREWTASKGGRVALRFSKGPGLLVSTAELPPGAARPPEHPFLNATALDPGAEDELRGILERSKSFDQFVGNLRAAGYEVAAPAPSR